MALPIPSHFHDLDPKRTFIVGASNFDRILGVFVLSMKGRPRFVDIAIVNDAGKIEFFNDKRCKCNRRLCEPGRSRCAVCRTTGTKKMRRYLARNRDKVNKRRRERRKERACTTESSSTPC